MRSSIFFILFVLVITGCSNEPNEKHVDFNYDEFIAYRNKWLASTISNYSYDYFAGAFIPYNWHAVVSNNTYFFTSDMGENVASLGKSIDALYLEIETLFLRAEYEFSVGTYDKDYYLTKITVLYETNYSYPKSVIYSCYSTPDIAVDGNSGWIITNFIQY